MSITAANVLSFVNAQLERSETSVDTELQTVLNELSEAGLLLGSDLTGTVSSSAISMAFPSGCKGIVSVILNGGSVDGAPLIPLGGGFEEYGRLMQSINTGCYGSPTHYAVFNRTLYPYLPPGRSYTVKLYYRKYHPQSVESILFGDQFANAINFGTTYYVAMKYGASRYISLWLPKYQQSFAMRQLDNDPAPAIVG